MLDHRMLHLIQLQTVNIILGDFNAHYQLWSKGTSNKQGDTLTEWINQNQLTILDPPPTHQTANLPRPSHLYPQTIPRLNDINKDNNTSDHHPIIVSYLTKQIFTTPPDFSPTYICPKGVGKFSGTN